MPTLDSDPLWDIHQVATYLNVPKRTLYRWRTLGYGPRGKRVGRHLRYRASDVIAWFADLSDHILDERWD
ncbi:excisionase family DNA binding protein [Kribbella sp. VKM Ac-2571]|uniref:helix-turn-helix transcriptional regulator n=1 Tax=Kribbella sp. VKM Ac-2571 TaxID=2512222 RepID=UPI0010E65DDB|nr:helix-turn-helix domain-containing protein [Kribbella sp. VKM Ac-2571]TDO68972.1 excisionase family DNA binding protein [Kribbella sp. VKM Ac-2571]